MSSTKTGEKAQLTVNKPNTDTSHPIDKPALFPWTSLSQEEILHEIQKGIKNLTGPNKCCIITMYVCMRGSYHYNIKECSRRKYTSIIHEDADV